MSVCPRPKMCLGRNGLFLGRRSVLDRGGRKGCTPTHCRGRTESCRFMSRLAPHLPGPVLALTSREQTMSFICGLGQFPGRVDAGEGERKGSREGEGQGGTGREEKDE